MDISHPDVDAYVAAQPEPARDVVTRVRETLRATVPEAEEAIRYRMPTLLLDGTSLVHFAAWAKHLGLYPLPEPAVADGVRPGLAAELAAYDTGKGTARFRYDREVPYGLIGEAVTALVAQRRSD